MIKRKKRVNEFTNLSEQIPLGMSDAKYGPPQTLGREIKWKYPHPLKRIYLIQNCDNLNRKTKSHRVKEVGGGGGVTEDPILFFTLTSNQNLPMPTSRGFSTSLHLCFQINLNEIPNKPDVEVVLGDGSFESRILSLPSCFEKKYLKKIYFFHFPMHTWKAVNNTKVYLRLESLLKPSFWILWNYYYECFKYFT